MEFYKKKILNGHYICYLGSSRYILFYFLSSDFFKYSQLRELLLFYFFYLKVFDTLRF